MKGGNKMVNIKKLRGKMVECGINMEQMAKEIGVDKSTMYRKMNQEGDNISIKEASIMAKKLDLSYAEVNSIFFSLEVA